MECLLIVRASNIAFRAHTNCVEDPRFEAHFELGCGRALTAHPAANGDPVETLENIGGEERNWPPYLTKPMA